MNKSYILDNMLYFQLDNVTQFPINCHFCIIDSTGLNKEYRENIIKIAKSLDEQMDSTQ
jgi:hypothetical protein